MHPRLPHDVWIEVLAFLCDEPWQYRCLLGLPNPLYAQLLPHLSTLARPSAVKSGACVWTRQVGSYTIEFDMQTCETNIKRERGRAWEWYLMGPGMEVEIVLLG